MKKFLLATLIASVASVASAQTTIYGLADAYYGSQSNAKNAAQVNSGGMSTSYIGISSTEKIGDIQAKGVLETFLRPDTAQQGRFNGDTFYARNAYVSLSNKAGEVQIGRVTTPMFISTVAFNALGDSFVFSPIVTTRFGVNNYNLAAGGTDSGWNNSVLVKSNLYGVTFTGVYSAGAVDDGISKHAGKTVGAMYFKGPIGLTATWQEVQQGLGKPAISSVIVGGSYDLKMMKLFAQYNKVENSDSLTKEDVGYSVGATMKIGAKNTAMLSYAKHDHNFADHKSAETSSWALGLTHAVSKRTDLYVAVRDTNYTNDGVNRNTVAWVDTRVTGVGMRHRF